MAWEIKINGFDHLERTLTNISGAELDRQMKRTMEISCDQVRDRARQQLEENKSVDTGELRRSVIKEVSKDSEGWKGVIGPSQPYGEPVEKGSRPHAVSAKKLESWAQKRGINPFALAASIRKKGTRPHPYMLPTLDRMRNKVIQNFENLIQAILKL